MKTVCHGLGLSAFAPLLVFVFSAHCHKIAGSDTALHIKAGEWIWQHGQVPKLDPFGYLTAEERWIDFEWLYQVLAYRLYDAGGAPLFTSFHALAAALAVLLAAAAAPRGVSWLARGLAALLPGLGQILYAWPRPQAVTMLFIGGYLLLLSRSPRLSRRVMIAILLLQIVWANLHGGYALGLLILILFAVAQGLAYRREPSEAGRVAFRRAAGLAALAAPCFLVNPYGWDLLAHGTSELSSRFARQYLGEWMSPFHIFWYLEIGLLSLLVIAAHLTSVLRPGRPPRFPALVAMAFGLLSLYSLRYIFLFALVTIPLLADNLAALSSQVGPGRQRRALRMAAWLAVTALPLIGTWLIWSGKFYALTHRPLQPGFGIHEERTPLAAAAFLRDHELPRPVYNGYGDGGWLLWRLYPPQRVFQDSRNMLYGDERMFEFWEPLFEPDRFAALLDKYEIQTVLLPIQDSAHLPVARRLLNDPGSLVVYVDAYSVILVRATEENRQRWPARDLRNERPPHEISYPHPARFARGSRLGALLFQPLSPRWTAHGGWINIYNMAGNKEMSAYWLAKDLEACPPYVPGYAFRLKTYWQLFNSLPEWKRQPAP